MRVALERLEAELGLARFEVGRLVRDGVFAGEPDGSFDLGWCRYAMRLWRHREPTLVEGLRREAASRLESFWVRSEILQRSTLAGPEARLRLLDLGRDALRHLHLLAAIQAGQERDRTLRMVSEIERAFVGLSCPRAAE